MVGIISSKAALRFTSLFINNYFRFVERPAALLKARQGATERYRD
jgi:hypothetical protein